MGYPIPVTVVLEQEACGVCGIQFAYPNYMMQKCKSDGDPVYCPNGHRLTYCKTKARELEEMLKKANLQNTNLAEQKLHAEREAEKAKKELKRIQKRAHAGVCTCCNRTFQNLARHMETKHGDQASPSKKST